MTKVKIICDEASRGRILLNGVDISGDCFSFEVSGEVGTIPIIYLGLRGDVEVEGEADVILRLPNNRTFTVKG